MGLVLRARGGGHFLTAELAEWFQQKKTTAAPGDLRLL